MCHGFWLHYRDMKAKQTPPCSKAFELILDHACDLESRVRLMESHIMGMSGSNTQESSSKLSIILEILIVTLPRTYLVVKQQRCRTWQAAPYPWETGKWGRFLWYFLSCWIDMFSWSPHKVAIFILFKECFCVRAAASSADKARLNHIHPRQLRRSRQRERSLFSGCNYTNSCFFLG